MHQLILQLAEGLTDNWYALETCLWGFWLVGIGFGVCLYFLCGKGGHTGIGLECLIY